jgi:hypothetical protein
MSVGAKCPRDEQNGFSLAHFDIMNMIILDDYKFINSVFGLRVNPLLLIFHHVAATGSQEQAGKKEDDKPGFTGEKVYH